MVNPSLLPLCLNEKWYKLAVYSIPTDHYPDTEEGMQYLQEDIEQSNRPITLTQPPRYISHLDKHAGKTASSIVITVRMQEELNKLKWNKVTVLF
jgi:diphthamide synthase subunit DPH2